MTRLGLVVLFSAGIAIPGALIIAVLALGFYSAWAIAIAAIVGLMIALPVSRWAARRIKVEDPEWDERREKPKEAPPGARPEKV